MWLQSYQTPLQREGRSLITEGLSWHTSETSDVLDRLRVDPEQGLPAREVEQRLREHRPNELIERSLKSPEHILWEQLTAVMVVVLIIAAR